MLEVGGRRAARHPFPRAFALFKQILYFDRYIKILAHGTVQ